MRTITIILSLLIYIALAQQWYMPDSRMISPEQFQVKIKQDKSTYKLVKFFTPHCVYCRYLKNVVDQLKHQKQWNFEIYDFNCGWYHQFCNGINTHSFPVTIIFDPNGNEQNRISGFYPMPVFKDYFDKLQTSSIEHKNKPISSEYVQENHQNVNQVIQQAPVQQQLQQNLQQNHQNEEPIEVKQPEQAPVQKAAQEQQQIVEQNKQQLTLTALSQNNHNEQAQDQQQQKPSFNVDQDQNDPVVQLRKIKENIIQATKSNEEIHVQNQQVRIHAQPHHSDTQSTTQSSIFHYLFYGACIAVGVCYFLKFTSNNSNKQSQQSPQIFRNVNNPQPFGAQIISPKKQYVQDKKIKEYKKTQDENIQALLDQQL